MFYYCKLINKLNLSSFNTKNCIDMSYMFYNCGFLKELNLSDDFQINEGTNISKMFGGWSKFKIPSKLRNNKDEKSCMYI